MVDGFSAKLDFTGRVALVTGGASGIGFAVATQLGELGAKVAIADVNIDGANDAVQRLISSGVEAVACGTRTARYRMVTSGAVVRR